METKIVTIDLDARSYDIYIGAGLLFRFADFVPVDLAGKSAFIITDSNVKSYADNIADLLAGAGTARVETLVLPPGEKTKSFKTVENITHWLTDHSVNRDSIIFAVGGGVIGDVAGFCAAITLRGIPYVHVPTTLLAQVDSSVGGKTGINVPQGKNLVGSFYQPLAVIADIDTLKTLPKRELLAGYAEAVKYGLIGDPSFFQWLEDNGRAVCDIDPDAMARVIETSVKSKAAVVQADEKETGQRALLNLGHTFGHALETAAGYDGRLLHGEAVSIGMCMAFDLSVRMGLCKREDMERVEDHLTTIGLPTRASFIQPALGTSIDKLLEIMGRDKKASKGEMRFVLVNGIGSAMVRGKVSEDLVRDVLQDSLGSEQTKQKIKGSWKSAFSSQS